MTKDKSIDPESRDALREKIEGSLRYESSTWEAVDGGPNLVAVQAAGVMALLSAEGLLLPDAEIDQAYRVGKTMGRLQAEAAQPDAAMLVAARLKGALAIFTDIELDRDALLSVAAQVLDVPGAAMMLRVENPPRDNYPPGVQPDAAGIALAANLEYWAQQRDEEGYAADDDAKRTRTSWLRRCADYIRAKAQGSRE